MQRDMLAESLSSRTVVAVVLERLEEIFAFCMAACSEREIQAALRCLQYLEEPTSAATDVFDACFEWLRHVLLEAWVETRASDRHRMAPCLDLLTSLKFRSQTPLQTATPLGGHETFRTLSR